MYLNFNGKQLNFQIIEQATNLISKHTGKPIQQLKLQTILRGEETNNDFLSLIESAKELGVTSQDNEGTLKQWKLGNNSWNYTSGSPIYEHTLEIKEVESFQISSLQIWDLIVQPYSYEESFDKGNLTIDAKVILTEEQHILWKKMLKSADEITVIRHGISDQPRQMALMMGYWSNDDNQIKHECRLIDSEKNSQSNPIATLLQWIRPMSCQVAENQALVDALVTTLVNKGVLSDDEANQVRSEAIDQAWENRYTFFKVDNLDAM